MGTSYVDYDIEKEFYRDVREKKRTASGIHSRKGKMGYVGKMKLASEMLRGKEKKEYLGNGKVVKYNMYTTVMNISEFEKLGDEKKRELFLKWREYHSNEDLMEKLGIGKVRFYELINELGMPKKRRWSTPKANLGEIKEMIEYSDFMNLDKDEQYIILDDMKKKYSLTQIKREWQISNGRLYKYLYEFDLVDKREEKDENNKNDKKKDQAEKSVAIKSEKKPVIKNDVVSEKVEETSLFEDNVQDVKEEPVVIEKIVEKERPVEVSVDVEKPIEDKKVDLKGRGKLIKLVKNEPVDVVVEEFEGFSVSFKGDFNSEQIVNKLKKMIHLVEGEKSNYRLEMNIREIRMDNDSYKVKELIDKVMDDNKDLNRVLLDQKIINEIKNELDVDFNKAVEIYAETVGY